MNIDYGQIITAESKKIADEKAAREGAIAMRKAAYQAESDPLRFEIEYDAILNGQEPDYTAWIESVTSIKERFPLLVGAESPDA